MIVPLFALANAGIAIDGDLLERAAGSPITLGILVGYVVGKPLGIVGTALLVTRLSRGRLRPAGRLGRRPRRRHDRRRRLHHLAAGGHAGLRRRAPRGGQGRHPRRGRGRDGPHLARLPRHGLLPGSGGSRRCWVATSRSSISTSRSTPSGPHPRAARRAGDRGRVRRLRVSVLRPSGAPGAGAAARLRRRALRLAPPAAVGRAPARPARGRGLGGRRRSGRVLADARPAARAPGRAAAAPTWCRYAEQLGLDVDRFSARSAATTPVRAGSSRTSKAPTSAACPARPRSSSTGAATTAPTTSRRCPAPCAQPARGRR